MRALMILGPTASGKSALAMALAQRLPVEIISVDSAQVYLGLDIGTAKPSAAERRQVPHHLIDIRDPADPYSAARFVSDAQTLIDRIRAGGSLPLLVGGTMLYARALLSPFDTLPPADPAIRSRLEREAAQQGWAALHQRLATLDPISAQRIRAGDPQRIQRALEVIEITGQPLSQLQTRTPPPAPGATSISSAGALPILSLEPSDRSVLHRRIAQRFDQMIGNGLVEEVRGLMTRPDLNAELPALRAVGYRQVWQYLAGGPDASGLRSAAGLREAGIAATRQLARRQLTWLRALPAYRRLDSLGPGLFEEASAIIESLDWRADAPAPQPSGECSS